MEFPICQYQLILPKSNSETFTIESAEIARIPMASKMDALQCDDKYPASSSCPVHPAISNGQDSGAMPRRFLSAVDTSHRSMTYKYIKYNVYKFNRVVT
jgi:hypothetical protein